MHDLLPYKTIVTLGIFLLIFTVERFKPAVQSGKDTVARILKNISFWPINIGVSIVIILPLSLYASLSNLWHRPVLMTGGIGLVLDIIILDLFLFWWHRAVHEIPFFWRYHVVHHLDEHLDSTSAIRFHCGEIIFASIVRAVLILVLAIPMISILVFESLVLIFTLFHHSNMIIPARLDRLLSKIIVTPSLHWVHHHAVRKDTDSNYGTIFSIWDRVFKTKSTTCRNDVMIIGVEGQLDQSFLTLLKKPFTRSEDEKNI